jgi:hypothetical protein
MAWLPEAEVFVNKDDAQKYLRMVGQELQKRSITGEILVTDDVVVILDIRKPKIRRDIDAYLAGDDSAIYIPRDIDAYFGGHGTATREALVSIAKHESLPDNWLNDALKEIFHEPTSRDEWLECPGLRVYVPVLEHALAMKVATADGPQDIEDIKILANKLRIASTREMLSCVTRYLSKQLLIPEMRQTVKEVFKQERPRKKVSKQ